MNEREDIASLVNRLRSMVTQLTYLDAQVPKEDKVVVLLGALPTSYDHIVAILEEKDPTPSLEDIVSSL